MENHHDEDLIKIRKREKKEKPEKREKRRPAKKRVRREVPPKAIPRTDGVKLDFSQEESPSYTKYYMTVSKRFRAARVLSIALLVCFIL